MEEFSVTIQALTPIWTGDANGKNSTLRETGIIGSLRWWYEASFRKMDKFACDHGKNDRCLIKARKNNQEIAHTDQHILFFGANGKRKMFNLHMGGGAKIFKNRPINIEPDATNREWHFGNGLIRKIKNE